MSAGYVLLRPRLGEPWQCLDQVLFPGPREDRAEVLTGFVGCASWIGSLFHNSLLVHRIQIFSNRRPSQFLNRSVAPPLLPLVQRREILVTSSLRQISDTHITIADSD